MPTCLACFTFAPSKKDFHQFTYKDHLRPLWIHALSKDDMAKATMEEFIRTAPGKHYVCASHFSRDSYTSYTSRDLKPDAIPMSRRVLPAVTTVSYNTLTVPSPPPTPGPPLLSTTPRARPSSSHHFSLRLADAAVPPCCRCCCKRETEKEIKKDPNYTPTTATTTKLPSSDYFIVSRDSLVELLSRCKACPEGKNSLKFSEEAHALSCQCVCTACGEEYYWTNSPVLPTANASPKEKLKKINLDMVVGSAVTAVGTARLNYFLKAVGLNTVSKTSFHRLKNDYLLPAVTSVFTKAQEGIFERLRDRLAKGEKLHVAGDGSFDTRGYSAEWCRYFLVDSESGEALVHILMNKKETGRSGTLEVACLEKALKLLAEKIGGVDHIETLVTDRHGAVIKMMKDRFPSIQHYFDPWHFFRNLTLHLLRITKPAYMGMVKFYSRTIINKAYNAVVEARGDATLAREMFRASLLCIAGVHDFTNDPSFTKFKRCTHSPPSAKYPVVPKGSRAYKRLQTVLYTDKNMEDIGSVSWMLKTSTCESLNSLAWRYAPKECYFDRNGHELRTMMCVLHWNELKRDEQEGTRVITGKKSYNNHTLKKPVLRNVKSKAKNIWRDQVKAKAYEIRSSLTATPYAIMKKEEIELQKRKDQWNKLNTPTVPLAADSNLDESEDEDDVPPPPLFDMQRIDGVIEEIRLLLEEDDEYNRKKDEELEDDE